MMRNLEYKEVLERIFRVRSVAEAAGIRYAVIQLNSKGITPMPVELEYDKDIGKDPVKSAKMLGYCYCINLAETDEWDLRYFVSEAFTDENGKRLEYVEGLFFG